MDKGLFQQFIEWIIHNGGLYILLLVIFAETGLFVGFFLPGDSLLFAAGIYVQDLSDAFYGVHPGIIILMVIIASVLGNFAGYWFGYHFGAGLFEKKDSLLFKKKYLFKARDFYEKYGKATIFIAKFLPILRTFAPIVAGIVKMKKGAFTLYNILGSTAWVLSMMLSGYYLQKWVENRFQFSLKDHIEAITIAIILITTLPVLFKLFFGKRDPQTEVSNDMVKDKGKDKKLL